MVMPTRPYSRVEVPTSQVTVKGGLLNVLDRHDRLVDTSWENVGRGHVAVPDALCGHPGLADGQCETDTSITVDPTKVPEEPDASYGPVFTAYRALECMPGALDYRDLAEKSLVRNETWAVEHAIQEAFFSDNSLIADADFLDLGAGAAVEGIALLEQWLGGVGGGLIHVMRYGAEHLIAEAKVRDYDDFLLYTRQGTPVVNGAGYQNIDSLGAPNASGYFLWASPWMTAYRTPVMFNEGYDLRKNKQTGIAERQFSVVQDCSIGAYYQVTGA